VIARLLGLRARRPEAFGAGAGYEPLDAGPDACAFVRGGGVLVVCELRPGAGGALRGTPGGEWREVLTGAERSFDRAVAVADAAAPEGAAVYERL
jgi:(1->4)-alpha-D-glucan 1-alpha-D-glucosylmutase